jgi:hypothetical protein
MFNHFKRNYVGNVGELVLPRTSCLFVRHFISESLLFVSQILITNRQAFGFDLVNNWSKNGRKQEYNTEHR